ncbi:MAG: hypothetical protein J7L40_04215, partial [Candidatus Marinimicrobia bacterium]|nr:hypothetical protein [Candidatus Neomarinimicrobiota bacterium]
INYSLFQNNQFYTSRKGTNLTKPQRKIDENMSVILSGVPIIIGTQSKDLFMPQKSKSLIDPSLRSG